MDVEQHGAGSVGHIRDIRGSVRQGIHQPSIDSAKAQPSFTGQFLGRGDVFQNPLHFCAGKIGVDDQARSIPDVVLHAAGTQPFTFGSSAPALPNDGVAHRDACYRVPRHSGLPLVGNADGGNIPGVDPDLLHSLAHGVQRCLQNLHRVMLYIAGLRIDLRELPLAHASYPAKRIEQHSPGTGRSLINGQNILSHHHNQPLLYLRANQPFLKNKRRKNPSPLPTT